MEEKKDEEEEEKDGEGDKEEEGDDEEEGEVFKEAGGAGNLKKLRCSCTGNLTPGLWIQRHSSHYITSIQRRGLLHRPKQELWNRNPERLSTQLHWNTYFCEDLYFLFV